MGYYTNYELQTVSGTDYETNYEQEISDFIDYNPFDEPTKWYRYEKEMKEFSQKHPNVVFEISGEGEENGDLWKAYFKNGKMQMCKAKIIYDDFNENLLQ